MAVIYFLLGVSVLMGAIFLVAFLWSLADGQYEDEYSPAWRILFDDTPQEHSDILTATKSRDEMLAQTSKQHKTD